MVNTGGSRTEISLLSADQAFEVLLDAYQHYSSFYICDCHIQNRCPSNHDDPFFHSVVELWKVGISMYMRSSEAVGAASSSPTLLCVGSGWVVHIHMLCWLAISLENVDTRGGTSLNVIRLRVVVKCAFYLFIFSVRHRERSSFVKRDTILKPLLPTAASRVTLAITRSVQWSFQSLPFIEPLPWSRSQPDLVKTVGSVGDDCA